MSISPLSDGAVPPGYTEVLYWKIAEKGRTILMNLLALPLSLVFVVITGGVVLLSGHLPEIGARTLSPGVIFIPVPLEPIIAMLAGGLVTLPIHEAVHGIAMRMYGARPQFGFSLKYMVAYATTPGYVFRRGPYLVIILAPLVVLNLLCYLGILLLASPPIIWFLAAAAIVNGGSAAGDLWMTALVLRYPASACFVDERDGMRVFMPGNESGAA